MGFPEHRLRRLRSSGAMRRLVRETALNIDDLVYPLFVRHGSGVKEPIKSMDGCYHFSPDTIVKEAEEVSKLGIPAVLLFGLPSKKDDKGCEAWSEKGAVQQAIREIKKQIPELLVITDICLCAYTTSGHCGIIKQKTPLRPVGYAGQAEDRRQKTLLRPVGYAGQTEGIPASDERGQAIDNDATCELLAKVALSHADAGADIVAPSDMMDGRVKFIREALEENDFKDVAIMSYAAKFASAFYGPFRDAAESAPAFGDRKGYQMDPANARQGLAEIALDIEEGADIVMIKPALPYLDIIAKAKMRFDCPIAAYNVSGEYMMLKSAAKAGLLDEQAAMLEMLTSVKRAGANIIITYFAKDAAKQMQKLK